LSSEDEIENIPDPSFTSDVTLRVASNSDKIPVISNPRVAHWAAKEEIAKDATKREHITPGSEDRGLLFLDVICRHTCG